MLNKKNSTCVITFLTHRVYILIAFPERPFGKPRRRWEYNIKMDLQEVGWGGVDWVELPQDRDMRRALVNGVTNLWVP